MPPTYFPLRWESTGDQWWYVTPIDWAAANGHYDLVRELLRLDSNHLIKLSSLRRIRRLEVVWDDEAQFDDVAKNRSIIAQKLLHEGDTKRGKNSLIGSGYGGWLLYTAASAGDFPFVQELLHKDPLLVFGEGEYGVTDVLYAAARGKNTEIFRLVYDFAMNPRFLVGNGGEIGENVGGIPSAYKREMKNRAVHALARGGNLGILKEILGDCCDDTVLGYRDIQGSTILHTAAGRGQFEVVKYLVSTYETLINSTDKQGNTPLHIAACRGHISIVDFLFKSTPSSIHTKNNIGETFLHTAITGFQTPTFRRLDRQIMLMKQLISSKSFNIEEIINDTDNEGRTPLHLAIHGNIDSDLVELLMSVRYINVNQRDNHGLTPLDLLKNRPVSASSEVLKRQLVSAGAIFGSQDYSTRKILANHLRKGSEGGSPGTTFSVADSEIFLYSGVENNPGTPETGLARIPSPARISPTRSVNTESKSLKKKKHKGIKRFIRWPKMRKTGEQVSIPIPKESEYPIPLRQRFSKPSSPTNNKRTLASRSNLPSPTAKKKVASGLVNGVMQAMPHINRRSRSDSFSRSSVSSHNSHTGVDIASGSGSNPVFDDGFLNKEHGVVSNRRSVNQYFCFGGSRLPMEPVGCDEMQPHEIYDRYVLSTA